MHFRPTVHPHQANFEASVRNFLNKTGFRLGLIVCACLPDLLFIAALLLDVLVVVVFAAAGLLGFFFVVVFKLYLLLAADRLLCFWLCNTLFVLISLLPTRRDALLCCAALWLLILMLFSALMECLCCCPSRLRLRRQLAASALTHTRCCCCLCFSAARCAAFLHFVGIWQFYLLLFFALVKGKGQVCCVEIMKSSLRIESLVAHCSFYCLSPLRDAAAHNLKTLKRICNNRLLNLFVNGGGKSNKARIACNVSETSKEI